MDVGCKTLWNTKKTIVAGRVSVLPYRRYRKDDTSCGNIPAIHAYAEVAQQLSEKNVKIQSRRGVKKHKDKAEKTEEAPVKTEKSAEEKPTFR